MAPATHERTTCECSSTILSAARRNSPAGAKPVASEANSGGARSGKGAQSKVSMLYSGDIYKKRFCASFPYNVRYCKRGNSCAFAHSRKEIRAPVLTEDQEKLKDSSDQFFLYKFKTTWCPIGAQHDWQTCVYAHTYQDARRDPRIGYGPKPCAHWDKKKPTTVYQKRCPLGFRCPYAHGAKEQMYHPAYFRTVPCIDFSSRGHCPRGKICAFYHGKSEKREVGRQSDADYNYSQALSDAAMTKLQPDFESPPLCMLTAEPPGMDNEVEYEEPQKAEIQIPEPVQEQPANDDMSNIYATVFRKEYEKNLKVLMHLDQMATGGYRGPPIGRAPPAGYPGYGPPPSYGAGSYRDMPYEMYQSWGQPSYGPEGGRPAGGRPFTATPGPDYKRGGYGGSTRGYDRLRDWHPMGPSAFGSDFGSLAQTISTANSSASGGEEAERYWGEDRHNGFSESQSVTVMLEKPGGNTELVDNPNTRIGQIVEKHCPTALQHRNVQVVDLVGRDVVPWGAQLGSLRTNDHGKVLLAIRVEA